MIATRTNFVVTKILKFEKLKISILNFEKTIRTLNELQTKRT